RRVGGAHPSDAVENARRRPTAGGAPAGFARHVVHGPLPRRARRRHVVSGEAPAALQRTTQQGHAAVLSMVDAMTPLSVNLPFNRDILGAAFTPAKRGGKPSAAGGHWILVQDQNLLVAPDAETFRLPHGACPLAGGPTAAPFWLGTYHDEPCWVLPVPGDAPIPAGLVRET